MKTIIIRLHDVEAAMLVEVQKKSKDFRDLHEYLGRLIRHEYRKKVMAGD